MFILFREVRLKQTIFYLCGKKHLYVQLIFCNRFFNLLVIGEILIETLTGFTHNIGITIFLNLYDFAFFGCKEDVASHS